MAIEFEGSTPQEVQDELEAKIAEVVNFADRLGLIAKEINSKQGGLNSPQAAGDVWVCVDQGGGTWKCKKVAN
jgi:hypothetical protein